MPRFYVYEAEYPEDGGLPVEVSNEDAAKAAYREEWGMDDDDDAELSVRPLSDAEWDRLHDCSGKGCGSCDGCQAEVERSRSFSEF